MHALSLMIQEHAECAAALLEEAAQAFNAGDVMEGSQRMSDTTSHTMLAAAKQRGWSSESHDDATRTSRSFAEERGELMLESGLFVLEKFLLGFYDPDQFNPFGDNGGLAGCGRMDFTGSKRLV